MITIRFWAVAARAIVAIGITAATSAKPLAAAAMAPTPQSDAAVARGVAWLLQQQQADGAWRSATYTQLGRGPAATALATAALARVASSESLSPDSQAAVRGALAKSLAYLVRRVDDSEQEPTADEAAEYPTYATALTLLALHRLPSAESEGHAEAIGRLADSLEKVQVIAPAPNKIAAASDVGGWGLVGGDPTDVSSFRNANVSTTRFALTALMAAGGDRAATLRRAEQFLAARQNADGGFAFLSDPLDQLNKAGASEPAAAGEPFVARSYGTATADSLLALRAAGATEKDARIVAAIGWLDAHPQLDPVPGFPADEVSTAAAQGLFYYYAAALADCIAAYPQAEFASRAPELAQELVARQRADGSWANAMSTMREDDPLTATCLALEALGGLTARDAEEGVGTADERR